jgi:hypothetical protein
VPAVGSIQRPYSECRPDIWDGDVALWAPVFRSVWAKVWHFIRRPLHFGIQDCTGSRWIHVAKLYWCYGYGQVEDGRLMLGEFTQKKGGSTATFLSQLKGESGNWHIFRPRFRHEWQRRESVLQFLDITGEPYNNWTIARNWVRSLPFIRWFVSRAAVDENDLSDFGYQVCAASVARADRKAGMDGFLNTPDWKVTPANFTTSPAYEYVLTPTL